MKYILASGSPRRVELIQKLHLPFEVQKALGEEVSKKTNPEEYVCELALHKALEVFNRLKNDSSSSNSSDLFVLGADTIVTLDNEILGKPKDSEDAKAMLRRLSGRSHKVFTGVAFAYSDSSSDSEGLQTLTFFDETEVTVEKLSDAEIEHYVATGDPLDKAGSYGIQGDFSIHISSIAGNYENVIGLPVSRIYEEMKGIFGEEF